MGRPGSIRRPFTVLDAMILVAGTSAGLASYSSAYLDLEHYFLNAHNTEDYIFSYATLGVRSASPFVSAWSLTWIVIRLRKPRIAWRRLFRQPGMSAMSAACLGWAVGKLNVLLAYTRQFHELPPAFTLNYYNAASILLGGFGVIIAWSGSTITGRWKPEPSWIDRLGRALGLVWVILFLVLASYWFTIEDI